MTGSPALHVSSKRQRRDCAFGGARADGVSSLTSIIEIFQLPRHRRRMISPASAEAPARCPYPRKCSLGSRRCAGHSLITAKYAHRAPAQMKPSMASSMLVRHLRKHHIAPEAEKLQRMSRKISPSKGGAASDVAERNSRVLNSVSSDAPLALEK